MSRQPEPDISWLKFFAQLILIVSIVALAIIIFNELIVKPAEEYERRNLTEHP